MSLEDSLRSLAVEIAYEAGHLARTRRQQGVALAATKSSLADIVTEADREVERLIRERLATARPDDGFLGEESDTSGGTSGLTWVVDPIDGTVNYAYGSPIYSVSIAVVHGAVHPDAWDVVASAVYAPGLGEMFSAQRHGGAWLGNQRLSVSTTTNAGALLGTGFGYDPSTHAEDLDLVAKVMPVARDLRRLGSAAIDLAYVAAGRLDGYFERGLKPWDIAGGTLLVTEAGGVVSRLDTTSERPLLVAAEPALHARLVARMEFSGESR